MIVYTTKYFFDFADVRQYKYRVLFKLRDYAGETTELTAGGTPFVQDIQQSDKYDPIAATLFDIQVFTQTGFDLRSIYSSDSREWRIDLVTLPISDDNLIFTGWIEGLKGGERLKGGRQTLSLTAACGLGQLRNELYQKDDGTPFTGLTTKREVIKNILAKTGLNLPFGIASNWVNAGDGLYSTTAVKITNEVYYEEDGTPLDCLTVLKDILGQLNCEIFQERGKWWIRNIDLLKGASYNYYVYNADGSFNSNPTFNNTKLQVGHTFKTTSESMYSALPPVRSFEASLKLSRYRNQLPNGDFTQYPRINLPQWTNTLFATEIGGTGAINDRVYVKITNPQRSPPDIKISNIITYAEMIIDLNESLISSPIAVNNNNLDIWRFSGWINASGPSVAVLMQFIVITNYGNFFLKQDGSFGDATTKYQTETFFEFYPDFQRQEGATRIGVPKWTEVTKEIDLAFFKRSIEINNAGPRDNPNPFTLQGIQMAVYRPSVRAPQALTDQYVQISNFRLVKRKQREVAAQVHVAKNDIKTSEKDRIQEFYTGDYFDTTELAATYFGDGVTPTATHIWSNPQTGQSGSILQLMVTERAKQYARVFLRIEGKIEGRQYSTDFDYSHVCEVTGFPGLIFKQIRRRYDIEQKSIEVELQEII